MPAALEITNTRTEHGYTVATLSDGREIGAKGDGNRWTGKMVDVSFIDVNNRTWGEHITLRSGTSVKMALEKALDTLNNPPPKVRTPRRKPTPEPEPKSHPVKDLVPGEGFLWLGVSHRLRLVDDGPTVGFANQHTHQSWLHLRRDVAVGDTLIDWYTRNGREYARDVASKWTPRLGLRGVEVKVRAPSKKWGQARRNTITIHWATFQLPCYLVEYVIVHELAHVADTSGGRSHGPEWRRIIDRCLFDRRERERDLATWELDVWMGGVGDAASQLW